MVHQSNAYFEHCHAADYEASLPVTTKRSCWAAWLEHYRMGQPPERIAYARDRVVALAMGDDVEQLPGMPQGVVGSTYTAAFLTEGGELSIAQAAAETPIPSVADGADIDAAASVEVAPSAVPVTDNVPATEIAPPTRARGACASYCNPRWDACVRDCAERESCERACDVEHRTCVRGCY